MRILFPYWPMGHLGGLINTNIHAISALRRMGHEAESCWLVPKEADAPITSWRGGHGDNWYYDETFGMPIHQLYGWGGMVKIPYVGKGLKVWQEYANSFDLIVFRIVVPTKNKNTRGNMDWLNIYDVKPKIIGWVADHRLLDAYPHFYEVKDKFTALAAVHRSAYTNALETGLPCAWVPAGMDLERFPKRTPPYEARPKGFASFQTYKGWKHVEDVIRATPYLPKGYKKYVAGEGVNYRYMATATDKCPPKFRVDEKHLPDFCPEHKGRRIWDLAVDHGLENLGLLSEPERNEWMMKTRVFVDSSWSKALHKYGGHVNRTTYEAILCGQILVGRDWGFGSCEMWKPEVNYIPAPHDCSPAEYAEVIKRANTLDQRTQKKMMKNNRALISLFNAENSVQSLLDLAQLSGKPGVFGKIERGEELPNLETLSKKSMKHFQESSEEEEDEGEEG